MNWVRPCAIMGEKVADSLRLPLTPIFQVPNGFTTTIAATRLYRSLRLMDLGSEPPEQLGHGIKDAGPVWAHPAQPD